MDPIIAGSLISAGSSLVGNLLGKKPPSVNKQMDRSYEAMNAAAEKYGVSKLVTFGGGVPQPSGGYSVGGDSIGATMANMGADIGRAVAAQKTDAERVLQQLTLQKAGLENDYLRAQIDSINNRTRRESAPPVPAINGLVPEKVIPPERTAGLNAGVGYPTNPYVSDMNSFTNRYGESEVFEMLGGAGVGLADAYWNGIIGGNGKIAARAARRFSRPYRGSTHYKNKW